MSNIQGPILWTIVGDNDHRRSHSYQLCNCNNIVYSLTIFKVYIYIITAIN